MLGINLASIAGAAIGVMLNESRFDRSGIIASSLLVFAVCGAPVGAVSILVRGGRLLMYRSATTVHLIYFSSLIALLAWPIALCYLVVQTAHWDASIL